MVEKLAGKLVKIQNVGLGILKKYLTPIQTYFNELFNTKIRMLMKFSPIKTSFVSLSAVIFPSRQNFNRNFTNENEFCFIICLYFFLQGNLNNLIGYKIRIGNS